MSSLAVLKQNWANLLRKAFLSHEVDINCDSLPVYQFAEDEVSYVFHTTNNMIKTPKGYFRYCWEHEPFETHRKHMAEYYDSISNRLDKSVSSRDVFVSQEMAYWRSHKKGGKFQTMNAGKMMAEEAIASLLGVERLLTKTHFCKVQVGDGEELIGTMMSDAGGVDVRFIKDTYKEVVTPQLVCDLNNLNILDAICHEKDHRPGNYHLILDEDGKAVSLCAFDNDSPWAFFPYGRLSFKSYERSSSIVKQDMINRPCVDAALANRVMSLDKKSFENKLSPYLNNCQIRACWKRIQDLQVVLEKSRSAFRQKDEWDESIVKEEISGKYGKTYLLILFNLYEKINHY